MQCRFVCIFLLIGWSDAGGSQFNDGGSSNFDASVTAFIATAIDYYKAVHGGPPEAEVSQVVLNAVKRIGNTHQSGLLEKVINSILPGITEVVISEPSQRYLESALYDPFHKLMGGFRMAARPEYNSYQRWYVQWTLGQLVDFVELFRSSNVQIGFFEYFAGLEEYVRALYPHQSSMSRTLTIELIETNMLNVIMREKGWNQYRTFTAADDGGYNPDLSKIEDFISQGVPEDADAKAKALSLVEEYISIVRESWDPKTSTKQDGENTTQLKLRFRERVEEVASKIPPIPEKN